MKKLAFAVLAVMLVVVSAGAARAGGPAPFKCTGSVGAVTVSGDLEVPAGHSCVLEGTTVTGNVTDRGSLVACGVHILGNLTADHAESLVLGIPDPITLRCDSTVGGKVLADRSLSRLLGSDWPRTLDELEALKLR